MKNNLFNLSRLREICDIEPSLEQIEVIKEWHKMVKNKELMGEVENYINFVFKILNKLLEYSESDIAFEHSYGDGRVEFSIRDPNKKDNFRLIIELKGQNIDLDKIQKRKGKTNRSPVDQAFYYAIASRSVQWIIVSNYNETRIYNYYKKKRYISFTASDLLEKENLRIFLGLLSKRSFLYDMIPDKALKETVIVEQKFTNEFYQLYHSTRLEIIKQLFETKKIEEKLIIHLSQTLLSRILFIAYAEDCGLLPSETLTRTILSPIKSKDVSIDRQEIWHKLNLLFYDLNVGKSDKQIPGYNGGLFSENLERVILYDLVDNKNDNNTLIPNHNFNYDKINEHLDIYKETINPVFKNFLVIASLNYKDQVNVEIFGHIFEQSVIDIENLKKESLESVLNKNDVQRRSKGRRKKEGIYYTPEIVTSEITRNSIIKYLSDKEDVYNLENLMIEYDDDIEKLENKLKSIKILDIACGSGAFLSQAVDILAEIYENINNIKIDKGFYKEGSLQKFIDIYGVKINIVKNSLYGADISEEAIEIAQVSLFLKLAHREYQLPDLKSNFFNGNSIINSKEVVEKPIIWNDISQKPFDIIITNPPYIPTESMEDEEKHYFSENYSVYRKFDTSILFIEKALELLKPKGILGVIIPLTWQTGENYELLRTNLFKKAKLIKLINLPFDIFPDAYVDTCIAIFEKEPFNKKDFYLTFQFDKSYKLATLHIDEWEKISAKEILDHPQKCVYTSDYYYTLWNKIINLKESNSFKSLGEISISTQGFHAGKYNRKKIKTTDYDIPFFEEGKANRHYIIINKKTYVDLSDWNNLVQFYTIPKIFIRRIINRQDRLMAFYVEEDLLTTKDYNPFVLKEEDNWNKKIDYNYLTAILNSKLISFLYIGFSAIALKDDFRQTVLRKLRFLPIPVADDEIQMKMKDLQIKLSSKLTIFEEKKELIGKTLSIKYKDKIKKSPTKLYEINKWKNDDLNKVFKGISIEETEELVEYIEKNKKLVNNIISQIKTLEQKIDIEVFDLFNVIDEERSLIEKRFPDKF